LKPFIWIGVFHLGVIGSMMYQNISFVEAFGFNIPSFVIGMILSPIWWWISKKYRNKRWEWYDWLNTGSYIMIIFKSLGVFMRGYIRSHHGI
jgi:hypothetical protein